MRALVLALLLGAACGGTSSSLSDGCNNRTSQGTFAFHAQQILAACGFPAAFDLSITVTSTGATGTENGVAFTAQPISSCQLAWRDATAYHVVEIDSHSETLVTGGCSAVYTLVPF
jgi:hypothetical protein